jgi:CheY-like chemotaxis protein
MIQLLVIDDDDINIFLFKHLLKKSGYEVQAKAFTKPAEALSYITQSIAELKRIDLILLDINMPLMTGWDLLNELRPDGESLLKDQRVYMLSSSVHKTDIEKAKDHTEVSGFISKPISLNFLTEIFGEILESKAELS